ncbi:flavin reductase family protein [Xanthobacter sp. AM11]|uniref:flavin reductase family protein n=1 Tax=Xanthobacter sp. AM11 TaxID=3380643 RepID=UPI0039BEDBA1
MPPHSHPSPAPDAAPDLTQHAAPDLLTDTAGLDPAAFRRTLGQFATGVAIVAAQGPDGAMVGMTMSSFNAVSLDPPLVLFSVARTARSLPVLRAAAAYGISVLARHQEALSARFARPLSPKWADLDIARGDGGAPLIPGAAAHLVCVPHAIHDGGDHEIFVARVRAHGARPAADPLIFHAGRYRSLAHGERTAP